MSSFHEDGFLVVRNVLNSDLIKILNSASKDVRINKTLHCEMAYYNGPPIFHKVKLDMFHFLSLHSFQYPHFCMWPDKIHDGFRDGLYKSPLGYLASRLMGNASVRVQNTFTMGSSSEDYTIPQ